MKQLLLLIKNQTRIVFGIIPIQIWIALAIVFMIVLIFNLKAESFPNGTIYYFFGKDIPNLEIMLSPILTLIINFGVIIFIPIGLTTSINSLIKLNEVVYFLSRPVSRTMLLIAHVKGSIVSFFIMIFSFYFLLWLIILCLTNTNLYILFYEAIKLFPVACAIFTLLLFFSIATRSANIGILFHLVYVFLLYGLLQGRLIDDAWWKKVINEILDILNHILPQIALDMKLNQAYDLHSLLLSVLNSILSILVFTTISVMIYRRMEF
jgi:ABC-type transport system involved in multi-copper enzyme maturation permease subunit